MIGGNLATNASGNRVIKYGTMRDQVLSVEAVLTSVPGVASHCAASAAGRRY
jgi:FAD/FMN-containing dehydrogenase